MEEYGQALLAIDPGEDTGVSVWNLETGSLEWCTVVSPDEAIGRYIPHRVVIEEPQVYMRSKANPADIISLARKVGRYEERYRYAEVTLVHPSEWKGNIDKDVMLNRIEGALTPEERDVVSKYNGPKGKRHNMIDSIGLGKFFLKKLRMDRALAAPEKV